LACGKGVFAASNDGRRVDLAGRADLLAAIHDCGAGPVISYQVFPLEYGRLMLFEPAGRPVRWPVLIVSMDNDEIISSLLL